MPTQPSCSKTLSSIEGLGGGMEPDREGTRIMSLERAESTFQLHSAVHGSESLVTGVAAPAAARRPPSIGKVTRCKARASSVGRVIARALACRKGASSSASAFVCPPFGHAQVCPTGGRLKTGTFPNNG